MKKNPLIILIKRINEYLFRKYFKIVNKIVFFRNSIPMEINSNIRGKLYISNRGTIKIGKGFTVNSGKNYNPIGGDIITRLVCVHGGKLEIGEDVGISNSTIFCTSHIEIGNHVMIGGGCKIWDTDFHSLDPIMRTSSKDSQIKSKPIIIKNYAFIGGMSIILKGVMIGSGSVIAAGSVVTKNVPDGEIWGGNPARFIRRVHD